jgi:DNA-binding NarL/FixJ family response regulator
VDTNRTNLMKKLDIHNLAGLVRVAIKAGPVR